MWVWKDGAGGYNAFLESLSPGGQNEFLTEGTLEGVNVFTIVVNKENAAAVTAD